eukprot:m.230377 g.230377  ORF g.230377 m.230377 type:complete len:78 (-) comp17353_c0_seq23:2646-2879(-)
MKFWRYQDQLRSQPGSATVSPLHFGGMVSNEASCSVAACLLYGRCEAYTNVVTKRRMTVGEAQGGGTMFGSKENVDI